MISEIKISNFKSILEDTIQLGNVNVFIGENGCGKSNILEAFALASCAKDDKLNTEGFYSKGIRVAKPALMYSSFFRKVQTKEINISIKFAGNISINSRLICELERGFASEWIDLTSKTIDTLIGLSEIEILKTINELKQRESGYAYRLIKNFVIYSLTTHALRGIYSESKKTPLGINGENLDVLIADFTENELIELQKYNYLISWLDNFVIDLEDSLKFKGFKPNKTSSRLYFRDKFMRSDQNFFSAENANEGILHLLFYLTLFISNQTPNFFAIDNIETSLNPHLCTEITRIICNLAGSKGKQVLITTHNPAVLDGLNLNDDSIRLFEVYRNDKGYTQTRRIKLSHETKPEKIKLSELWTRGFLGGISKNF